MRSNISIEHEIQDYRAANPGYRPPELSDHPCVLALTNAIMPILVNRYGGIVPFWSGLLDHVQEWFEPDDSSIEYRIFRGRLIGACGLAAGSRLKLWIGAIYDRHQRWRQTAP